MSNGTSAVFTPCSRDDSMSCAGKIVLPSSIHTAAIGGDMMQDLKVGQILGGTPWRMQLGELIGVVFAAAVLTLPLMALHRAYVIGSPALPAPQAGLMALMANGIVAGEMAWPLVIVGMFLALALILIGAPSPMLIAVGMYLPFSSTAAIFVGGLMRWILEVFLAKRDARMRRPKCGQNTRSRGGSHASTTSGGGICLLLATRLEPPDAPGLDCPRRVSAPRLRVGRSTRAPVPAPHHWGLCVILPQRWQP